MTTTQTRATRAAMQTKARRRKQGRYPTRQQKDVFRRYLARETLNLEERVILHAYVDTFNLSLTPFGA